MIGNQFFGLVKKWWKTYFFHVNLCANHDTIFLLLYPLERFNAFISQNGMHYEYENLYTHCCTLIVTHQVSHGDMAWDEIQFQPRSQLYIEMNWMSSSWTCQTLFSLQKFNWLCRIWMCVRCVYFVFLIIMCLIVWMLLILPVPIS